MNDHVKNVCKIGQGNDCCRYLTMGSEGFECVKNSSVAATLDMRASTETMTAQADNCEGKSIEELKPKKVEQDGK